MARRNTYSLIRILPGILSDLLEKGAIQLLELKRTEDVGMTIDPKYCRFHRMVSHPLEKCITLKEHIMRLIEDGTIILDLDNVTETNRISCQTKGLSLIQFGSLEPAVLYEPGLPSLTTQGEFFPVRVFNKLIVNMTLCSKVKEEADEEDGRQKNSLDDEQGLGCFRGY